MKTTNELLERINPAIEGMEKAEVLENLKNLYEMGASSIDYMNGQDFGQDEEINVADALADLESVEYALSSESKEFTELQKALAEAIYREAIDLSHDNYSDDYGHFSAVRKSLSHNLILLKRLIEELEA